MFSTVATTYARPVVVPAVRVVVATPFTVVKDDELKVPKVVVRVIVAPFTISPSAVNTSTRIVAWLEPLASNPPEPYNALMEMELPLKLGPTKSSISAVQAVNKEAQKINVIYEMLRKIRMT